MISRIINIKECFCESLTVKATLKYSNISSEGKKEGKILKIAVHLGPLCLFDTLNFPGFTRNLATVFEFKARPKKETRCFLLDDKTCAGVSWLYLYRREENHKDRWGNCPRRSRFSRIIDLLPVNYRYWIRPPVAFYNFGPSVSSISIQYLCAKIIKNPSNRREISSWVYILTRY